MNVADEIRRIAKDLSYIKIQLSTVRAYGGGHAYPYTDMANTADPGAPGAGYVRFFANNEHLIGLTSDDSWHDLSAGAKGVSSCIHEMITVIDAGGLNITWSAGKIFDAEITGGSQIVDIPAQPVNQACAASELNYLFYDRSAGALALDTIGPDYTDGDFSIAHILTLHNDILGILQRPVCYESIQKIRHVLKEAFPAVISSGMLISEHAGANAFDVDQSPGSFAYGGFEVIPGDAIDSTVKNIIRWFHNAADVWEADTNSQIDAANWDDPTDGAVPQANTANKYYRSTFYSCGDHIHWVYPQVEYDNINAALIAPDPTPPAALEHLPKTTTVVLKGNATAFPASGSDQWIDVRPMLGVNGGNGVISSHANLSDLAWTSCGHSGTANRYIGFDGAGAAQERTYAQVLADLSAQAAAAFNWNAQNLTNIGTLSANGITDVSTIVTNIAAGTTGQRPAGAVGDIRWNSTLGKYEAYDGAWENVLLSGDIGIADNKLLEVDQGAGLTNGDIVRATAAGVESRTDAEILAQLSGNAGAAFDWNNQKLDSVDTIDLDGGQIAFPAAQNPSANVNTLDDYEEGTWTPDLQFSNAKVGIAYLAQGGLYVKIGRKVVVTGAFNLTSKGSSNGLAFIWGLPFSIANIHGAYAPVNLRAVAVTFSDQLIGFGAKNSSQIRLENVTEAGVVSYLTDANFADDSSMMFSFTYFVN